MKLNTVEEIKKAVDAGKTVFADTKAYRVIKNKQNYYIVCSFNQYTVGLHGLEDTPYANKLNGTSFWTEEVDA